MKTSPFATSFAAAIAMQLAIPAACSATATNGDVAVYGLDQGQQRHSALKQITPGNVKKLVPVWNLSLASNHTQSQQPLVIDGIMYLPTADATLAVDALSGRQLWKTPISYAPDVFGVVCCGILNRGLAAHHGKLYRGTLDAHLTALDMKSGKELWRTKLQDYKEGYAITGAPLVANGVLISGISGGEYGTRGFIAGFDPDTGRELWRRHTTAAPDEPGGDTWPGETYQRGGGPTWLTGTYDPELDLVYWGVGNAGPWNPAYRKGDNLYIASVIAVRPKTGEVVWHYQFSPNDPFDYDGANELVIADLPIDGVKRKVIMQANRNGYFYVLDRSSGQLLQANPFVDKITWAKGIDIKTGRPIDSDDTRKIRASLVMDKPIDVWPSALGGKNWSPMSYDPASGLVYANTLNIGFPYKAVEPEYNKGTFYLGMEFTALTWPQDGNRGYLKAIDPVSGKTRWQVPSAIPNFAGVLTTSGGLLFTGAMTGEFLAYDSKTGKKLWQFQTGSGIVGMPITWERNGRQYVTVTCGIGGVYTLFSGDERLKNIPAGGSVWTFALMEN